MTDTDQPIDTPVNPADPLKEHRHLLPAKDRKVPSLDQDQTIGAGGKFGVSEDDIERELQEAMGGMSEKEIFAEPVRSEQQAGEGTDQNRKVGRVIRVHAPDVFLALPGGRSEGLLSVMQFPDGPPAVGTEVEVTIEGYDNSNGLLILSRKGAAMQADWSSVTRGMIVEARVTGTNKGGLEVDVNGIRGFLPISQIDLYRVENPDQFLNQRFLCMVTEADPHDRNLVVSRRDLLEKEREEAKAKLWLELEEGQVREGIVRSVKDFGAFVDLGGVDGLVHVSEISWARIQDASTALQTGQKVKVVVLKLDRERHKVSLGMKQLMTSPWDEASTRFQVGSVVAGKVTRLMEFGAFVELEPGIEGLIHISELAPQRVRRVKDIVQAGQEVQVLILSVDPEQRRISLSLKGALPKAEESVAEEEEDKVPAKAPRPRTTPLRGGIGSS
jgi:small subunit ribosomal protein S1